MTSSPRTSQQLLMMGSLLGGAASHRSAAALHGFDGFGLELAEVSFRRGSERELPVDVVVHSWRYGSRHDTAMVQGIRCTSVARTLVQLGAVCSRRAVERALDAAIRDGASMRWIEETLERLNRPGVTGARVLRSILEDPRRAVHVESVLERRVERALRSTGLPGLVTQHEIVTPHARYRVDMAYPAARIAIEGHSRKHHSGLLAGESDSGRHLALSAQGWVVLYVTWKMLNDPESFLPDLIASYRRRIGASAGLAG
jgi:very-short-patch-repair endonuclease